MFGRKLRDLQGRHVLHSMLILRWQQHVGKSAVAVAVALGYAHPVDLKKFLHGHLCAMQIRKAEPVPSIFH